MGDSASNVSGRWQTQRGRIRYRKRGAKRERDTYHDQGEKPTEPQGQLRDCTNTPRSLEGESLALHAGLQSAEDSRVGTYRSPKIRPRHALACRLRAQGYLTQSKHNPRLACRLRAQGYLTQSKHTRVTNAPITAERRAALLQAAREAARERSPSCRAGRVGGLLPGPEEPAPPSYTAPLFRGVLPHARSPRYCCPIGTHRTCSDTTHSSFSQLEDHITRTLSAAAVRTWRYTYAPESTVTFRAQGGWQALDAETLGPSSPRDYSNSRTYRPDTDATAMKWACAACTFLNRDDVLACAMCGGPRQPPARGLEAADLRLLRLNLWRNALSAPDQAPRGRATGTKPRAP